ncbi:MAG TPA: cobalt-precorrin-6A reductase [Alphaproteobacteria bacterium]|nr:cobalt-precorrin-6A reductase [Alphaproteobacteria bacterium]
MAEPRRLLILGGTGEALALAARVAALPGLQVITALAGRTRAPARPVGEVRTGGFGGADGLAQYISETNISVVVDAAHPFAAQISQNAAEACARAGVRRLMLKRPPWRKVEGDDWIEVDDIPAAARALPAAARRVFLAIGRQELAPFAVLAERWFLLRLVEAPAEPLPLAQHQLVIGRGPFIAAAERQLLAGYGIEAVVSKNSGGAATYAKLAAARALGLPVVMVRRPPLPDGPRVETVDEAVEWVEEQL